MTAQRDDRFRWYEGLAICLALFGGQMSGELINQWGNYFYSPTLGTGRTVYVSIAVVSVIFVFPIALNCVTNPLIALWSDKTNPRREWLRPFQIQGRRRPYIFWGSILQTCTAILFWFPPIAGTSAANAVYGVVILGLHVAIFATMTTIPITALGIEVARTPRERMALGVWVALGMIVGLAAAAVLPGLLIEKLDPARHLPGAEGFSALGYQRTAMAFALVAFALIQLPVWVIRERYQRTAEPEKTRILPELMSAFKNRLLQFYVAAFLLFNIGYLAVQRVLAYWAELGLNGSEETVTYLMAPFILAALIALPVVPMLARRLALKWLLFLCFAIITVGLPAMYPIATMDASGVGRAFVQVSDAVGYGAPRAAIEKAQQKNVEDTMKAETSSMSAQAPVPARGGGDPYNNLGKVLLGVALFFCCGLGQGIMFAILTPLQGEMIDLDEIKTGQRREGVFNSLTDVAWKVSAALAVCVPNVSMYFWGNSVDRPYGVFAVGPIAGVFGVLGLIVVYYYPVFRLRREEGDDFPANAGNETALETEPAP
ncbi:MAG TPA: MFS transporter [Candidatus Hydrogenedentes bacterium]|nr:MFS transporter [Candidatus Hydrogenedentota bacterium]